MIHYPPLKRGQRKQIRSNFFEKLQKDKDDVSIKQRVLDYILDDDCKILEEDWDGREIRNGENATFDLLFQCVSLIDSFLLCSLPNCCGHCSVSRSD